MKFPARRSVFRSSAELSFHVNDSIANFLELSLLALMLSSAHLSHELNKMPRISFSTSQPSVSSSMCCVVQRYIKILVVKNIRTNVMVGLATKSINITSLTHSFASLLGQLFLSGDTARLHAPVSLVGQGLSCTTLG